MVTRLVAVTRLAAAVLFLAWALLAAPQRVISTAPSFTETMFALGAGERVVGVSNHCHFPAAVDKLPKVGSYLKPNIEAIVRLKPDLVLVHKEQPEVAGQLARLGIRTLALNNTGLADTFASSRAIGVALGMEKESVTLERSIRDRLDRVRKTHLGGSRKSLLFIVGRTPGRLDGLVAVGKGSFLNELIAIAGGRNVLEDSLVTYPRISVEGVLRLDPGVIVDMGDMAQTVGVTEAHKQDVVKLWQRQPTLKAVVSKRVYAVAADIFVVPGPRIAETAEAFARMLHEGSAR